MAPKSKPAAKDPDIHKVERLSGSLQHQRAGLRQRRRRRDAERARHSVYRAQSRRELSRPARLHRQLPRQRAAADAALPARRSRGRDRARLRQGHRQGDGRGGALQRRPVPRHHGDLQRLVRPHADPDSRRHRSGRRHEAPAVDRLDPHRRRPGRASSATITKWDDQPASAGAARELVLRAYWMSNTAPCGPTYINLDAEVQEGKLPAPLPPIDAKRYMPPVVQGPSADLVKKAADILLARQEAADPGRPHVAQGRGLEAAHRARRGDRRARGHQPQDRRGVPDRSSAAYRLSRDLRHRRPDQRGEGCRRHPQPRLGRSRRHLQGHRRRAVGDRDPGLARPEPAQRLEHGLRGSAGGGPVHPGRNRRHRRGAARSRRRARPSRRSRISSASIR